jgi:hypothetical protein
MRFFFKQSEHQNRMDERGMEEEGKDREGEGWGIKENVG